LESWRQHWRTAYENFENRANDVAGPELFDSE
jgi:hypothetical protein